MRRPLSVYISQGNIVPSGHQTDSVRTADINVATQRRTMPACLLGSACIYILEIAHCDPIELIKISDNFLLFISRSAAVIDTSFETVNIHIHLLHTSSIIPNIRVDLWNERLSKAVLSYIQYNSEYCWCIPAVLFAISLLYGVEPSCSE